MTLRGLNELPSVQYFVRLTDKWNTGGLLAKFWTAIRNLLKYLAYGSGIAALQCLFLYRYHAAEPLGWP
jgi:hypothetical protein